MRLVACSFPRTVGSVKGLAYVHVLAMLLPSALGGGAAAQESVTAYTLMFGAYLVARITRAILDRKAEKGQ